jgi:hypothetical protein
MRGFRNGVGFGRTENILAGWLERMVRARIGGNGNVWFEKRDHPCMMGVSACCEKRSKQKEVATLFTSLSRFLTLSSLLFSLPFGSSTVETKLCDPDVNSQAGYFKITGSKDKNCT